MRHFSRSDLNSEKHQQDGVKCSDGTKPFHNMLEFSRVLPTKAPTAMFLSPAARSLSDRDTDCRRQALVIPYSSTPRHLPDKRSPHFSAKMSVLPRNFSSSQPLEDTGFESQELKRSRSVSATGACPSFEMPVPWYQNNLTDYEESSKLGMQKLTPARSCSVAGQMRGMSAFQADYWACAIPDFLPPSPDRQSPLWNPNKEYEDLLDYTYPLRPKYKLPKNLKYSTVHDSGIDLDSLSISPESTLKSVSMWDQEHKTRESPTIQRLSNPFLKKLECSVPVSHYRISPIGKMSLAEGGIDISGRMTPSLSPRCSEPSHSTFVTEECHKKRHGGVSRRRATSGNFLRTTSVLAFQQEWASDDEYLSLPPKLMELETLAQRLAEVTLTIKKPEFGQVQDDFPCISVNGEQLLSEVQGDSSDGNESQWELYSDSFHTCNFQEPDEMDILRDRTSKEQESESRETASTDFLEIRCPEFLSMKEKKDHHSLAQCIKVFCCQLEELIGWLQKVAEVTEQWIPPKPDVESVKASFQNYLELKKDLAKHQALTESVLQDGENLLKCMSTNSPVLQETLGLIAKHSEMLKSHPERLYESILTAMCTLDDGLKKHCDVQETAVHKDTSE
ncbi:centrosomal protein of 68 kDa isoform X1 [Thamnophis elegans]|uniref:centrosomal protein of 68 kDa isoform X1 n=2 Tax=Thamnophis elegans TaxID=35005 RepID=UPI001379088C|nr:centrosomal protein of 68 kDa isoform X1 [Thamnophis elegans]